MSLLNLTLVYKRVPSTVEFVLVCLFLCHPLQLGLVAMQVVDDSGASCLCTVMDFILNSLDVHYVFVWIVKSARAHIFTFLTLYFRMNCHACSIQRN